MTFISIEFFILFGVVLLFYYVLPHRPQNILLLLASLIFYGWWDWRFLGLLLGTSTLDFICAQLLDQTRHPEFSPRQRKLILLLSVTVNIGALGFFKYCNFFIESLLQLSRHFHMPIHPPFLSIVLPIGISFYTFHEMSYTIDVYRGKFKSTDDYVDYLLYICFFPHLVAGPIQRPANLLPQIQLPRINRLENVFTGAQLAFVGFFKKMVIADNLAVIVQDVFRTAQPPGGFVLVGTYAFAFQIYCDFSGYTDIARGIARMLGIQIPLNFNLPYFATNPREFWQRWHISLSTWLRDYVYVPLGGNRKGERIRYRNVWITMLLGGLWHGASWHFVLWGAFHAALLSFYHFLSRLRPGSLSASAANSLPFWIRVLVFFQLTCLGWLIFRVDNLKQLKDYLVAICTDMHWKDLLSFQLAEVVALAAVLFFIELLEYSKSDLEPWRGWPLWTRSFMYLAMTYAIILYGSPATTPFIYFQF